ncbi:hypothetical protein FISHEDRAFT_70400 [Fistulina hepatica ATCC 64428]|uniref:Uncharacterized protein n=1 Tax=Fistulina hepatica ATCC 64428 TaxID=1128425 RepID=A0A0D7AKS8_9AGAR|nr:hypothetical protein FISHEDRAFT_70400 [Fistulina hepatica ATCC 64428]
MWAEDIARGMKPDLTAARCLLVQVGEVLAIVSTIRSVSRHTATVLHGSLYATSPNQRIVALSGSHRPPVGKSGAWPNIAHPTSTWLNCESTHRASPHGLDLRYHARGGGEVGDAQLVCHPGLTGRSPHSLASQGWQRRATDVGWTGVGPVDDTRVGRWSSYPIWVGDERAVRICGVDVPLSIQVGRGMPGDEDIYHS